MVEKFGTSEFDNSTGAYELDLSLVDDFELAWRTMHVQSDVFCSASVVLPDRGGRQLNVGGWSLDSTRGVRLYWPDGSAGVNGTNDWEENFNELKLQVRIFTSQRLASDMFTRHYLASALVPFRNGDVQRLYSGHGRRAGQQRAR